MGGMDFSIADATRKKNEDQLMKGAVDAFKERAQLLTEALGGKGYKLVSLSVNSAGAPRPYPVMRMAAMKADASFGGAQAPEIEAGTSQVTVNADGVIEVQMP
ncbi:SIMPL domain-containing protein, partial [Serratia marcescens]